MASASEGERESAASRPRHVRSRSSPSRPSPDTCIDSTASTPKRSEAVPKRADSGTLAFTPLDSLQARGRFYAERRAQLVEVKRTLAFAQQESSDPPRLDACYAADPAAAVHAPDRLLGPEEHAFSKQLGSMVHPAVDVGSGSI
jgi:hypothetical protein